MLEWIDWTWVAYIVAALIFFGGFSRGFEQIVYQLRQIHGELCRKDFEVNTEVEELKDTLEQELTSLRDQNEELQDNLKDILHELQLIRVDTESMSGLGGAKPAMAEE